MYCGDDVSAIVGDVGTAYSKFGCAGEDMPRLVTPSCVGVMTGANQVSKKYYVGDGAVSYRRDGMEMKSSLTDGQISDWDIVENLWHFAFDNTLRVDPKEHPVLAAESAFACVESQTKYIELMFEKFDVPSFYLGKDAVLNAFSFGRSSALSVDCGAGSTRVIPVHDGYVLKTPSQNSILGGSHLDDYLEILLRAAGVSVKPRYSFMRRQQRDGSIEVTPLSFPNTHESYARYMRLEVARDIKESVCSMPVSPLNEELASALPPESYELPDGKRLEIGMERFKVPELLLNPIDKKGDKVKPLQRQIYDCVQACDPDVRREMLNHIVLTGGGSLFPTMAERLHSEVMNMVPSTFRVRFVTAGALEKKFSVFIGGSILASLGSFQQMWVSKADYDESGAASLATHRFP